MEDRRDKSNIIGSEIIIYQTEDGQTKIDVKFEDEIVWLTQAQLCKLYQTSKSNISEHIKHIFEEEEIDEKSVIRKFRTTAADGKSYNTIHYNLDIASIFCRKRGCRFSFRYVAFRLSIAFVVYMTFLTAVENLKMGEIASQFCFQLRIEFGYFSLHFSVTRSRASRAFSSVGAW